MFPISDKDGNIVGFGGRALVDNGDSKYINTADTELFSKRGELFAFHIAKHYARDFLIVCEGYMDALSMHQAGIKQAVASMGTAFTPEHAELIKRYTDTVVVAQDSDKAGNESAEKMARVLAKYNISTVRLSTRPYNDPDEFIKNEGGDAFKERIRQAIANKYNEYQLLTDR